MTTRKRENEKDKVEMDRARRCRFYRKLRLFWPRAVLSARAFCIVIGGGLVLYIDMYVGGYVSGIYRRCKKCIASVYKNRMNKRESMLNFGLACTYNLDMNLRNGYSIGNIYK